MPGRKSPRRRKTKPNKALAGTAVEDITQQQYQRAWDLYRTGINAAQICRVAGLTRRQLEWLHRSGNPARKMEAFETRLVAEREAIRSQAIEACQEISGRGVNVLRRAAIAAETATFVVNQIFRSLVDEITRNAGEAVQKPLAELMPTAPILETLRVLRPYCDLTKIATAYRLIYGQSAGGPVDPLGAMPQMRLDAVGNDVPLPAAVELTDEFANTKTMSPFIEAAAKEISGWTPEQISHFVETGEEPPISEIIDANAVQG